MTNDQLHRRQAILGHYRRRAARREYKLRPHFALLRYPR